MRRRATTEVTFTLTRGELLALRHFALRLVRETRQAATQAKLLRRFVRRKFGAG